MGELRGDLAHNTLRDLVILVLNRNCDNREEFERRILMSAEWARLDETLAKTARPKKEGATPQPLMSKLQAFPKRSEWLKAEMEKRKLTAYQLHKSGGPDRKTINRLLAGEPVREDTLQKACGWSLVQRQRTSYRERYPFQMTGK
jgi:hypothetical protein